MQVIKSETFNFDIKIITTAGELQTEIRNVVRHGPAYKNPIRYNMRLSIEDLFQFGGTEAEADSGAPSYTRRVAGLREPSMILDMVEIEDKAAHIVKADASGSNDQTFFEDFAVQCINVFLNPSHFILLDDVQGYQTWAAIDSDSVRRHTGGDKEALTFGIQPLIMNRWTGEALVRYKETLAELQNQKKPQS